MTEEEKQKRQELNKFILIYDRLYAQVRHEHTKVKLEDLKAANEALIKLFSI